MRRKEIKDLLQDGLDLSVLKFKDLFDNQRDVQWNTQQTYNIQYAQQYLNRTQSQLPSSVYPSSTLPSSVYPSSTLAGAGICEPCKNTRIITNIPPGKNPPLLTNPPRKNITTVRTNTTTVEEETIKEYIIPSILPRKIPVSIPLCNETVQSDVTLYQNIVFGFYHFTGVVGSIFKVDILQDNTTDNTNIDNTNPSNTTSNNTTTYVFIPGEYIQSDIIAINTQHYMTLNSKQKYLQKFIEEYTSTHIEDYTYTWEIVKSGIELDEETIQVDLTLCYVGEFTYEYAKICNTGFLRDFLNTTLEKVEYVVEKISDTQFNVYRDVKVSSNYKYTYTTQITLDKFNLLSSDVKSIVLCLEPVIETTPSIQNLLSGDKQYKIHKNTQYLPSSFIQHVYFGNTETVKEQTTIKTSITHGLYVCRLILYSSDIIQSQSTFIDEYYYNIHNNKFEKITDLNTIHENFIYLFKEGNGVYDLSIEYSV